MSKTRLTKVNRIMRITKELDELTKLGIKVRLRKHGDFDKLFVEIKGPSESLYNDGHFLICISYSDDYPFKSPSVGFCTNIFHPNVDFRSGTICLNTLNQDWKEFVTLADIITVHLPTLLCNPNPDDPLNDEAGTMYKKNFKEYKKKCLKFTKNSLKSNLNNIGKVYYKSKESLKKSLSNQMDNKLNDEEDSDDSLDSAFLGSTAEDGNENEVQNQSSENDEEMGNNNMKAKMGTNKINNGFRNGIRNEIRNRNKIKHRIEMDLDENIGKEIESNLFILKNGEKVKKDKESESKLKLWWHRSSSLPHTQSSSPSPFFGFVKPNSKVFKKCPKFELDNENCEFDELSSVDSDPTGDILMDQL